MDRSRVGPFALEQSLRMDGKGSVHMAIHLEKRRSVALKVFSAPLVKSQSDIRDAYRKEFHKLKKLRHPNIVRCYGGSFDGMEGYIASELIRGESLETLLQRRGRVSWETVVEYALQVSEALHYAHEAGVLHGDLAPDKVLIDQLGQVKVADFRLARHHSGNYTAPRFRQVGDAALVAPELFEPANEPTVRSDLYSLGVLIYLLLTGEPPILADNVNQLIERKSTQVPARLSTRIMDCPIWLDVLVGQLLEIDPIKRPYSAAAVSMALQETKRNVAEGTSVAEHALSGLSPLQMATDKAEARKVLGKKVAQEDRPEGPPLAERPWFLAVCLIVLVGGALTWLLWPVSEHKLFEKARVLMETKDTNKWKEARRRYLKPLLEKFPDGEYAAQAQQYLDQVQMAVAEEQMKLKVRMRRPRSEGERLYLEALSYEQFGDRQTAIEKYDSLIKLLDSVEEAQPYVNLARRQIEKLRSVSDETVAGLKIVEDRLADAEKLAEDGEQEQARDIWKSILSLYGNNPDFVDQVERAKAKLGDPAAADEEKTPDKSESREADQKRRRSSPRD